MRLIMTLVFLCSLVYAEDKSPLIEEYEGLKNSIISFKRLDYNVGGGEISDPFIYLDKFTKEEIEARERLENSPLILKGVFESKAKINNSWVSANELIDGWKVVKVHRDRVELVFNNINRVIYVKRTNIEIK